METLFVLAELLMIPISLDNPEEGFDLCLSVAGGCFQFIVAVVKQTFREAVVQTCEDMDSEILSTSSKARPKVFRVFGSA